MTTAEKMVASVARRAGLLLTGAELSGIVALVDKAGSLAPEAEVVAQFNQGTLTSGMVTFFLPRMWRYRLDDSPVSVDTWREMFRYAMYTEDGVVKSQPKGRFRVYRGATDDNREGLSWSLDLEQARYFARFRQAPGVTAAQVWIADVPAERVLARFADEKEVTADVRGLCIYPAGEAHRLPRLHWWQRKR